LLSIYSPELYQSEQEYLIELSARERPLPGHLHDTATDSSKAAVPLEHESGARSAARQRLRLLGVPEDELQRLDRERTASTRLTLRAPVAGTVLEKNVVDGQYVGPDVALFTLADLGRVWVLADLYEMDLGRLKVGDRAVFVSDGLPNRTFQGRVEFVYPTVSSETRTLKVRVALANLGGVLRPGMYGRVRVSGSGTSTLSAPAEAIVRAGDQDYVFLARAGGRFEPRRVALGRQDGDCVQVLAGLAEGDTVVASASFLIDSESRLQAALAGMKAQSPPGHSH
jgi:Cu(I)/Ag(I) efflux system membrane fusion protein